MQKNGSWQYTVLQMNDLPPKTQKFISIMNLDISKLTLVLLKADPNGWYGKLLQGSNNAEYNRFEKTIYFKNQLSISVTIHELMHFYLDYFNYDTKAITEEFVKLHGQDALPTNYALLNFYEKNWDEVVCEIVAAYGRRGQFEKIKELFKQEYYSSEERGYMKFFKNYPKEYMDYLKESKPQK